MGSYADKTIHIKHTGGVICGGGRRRGEGLKAIDFRNIFRRILTLCTGIILSTSLESGWGERFDHDRWSQKCTKISEWYFRRLSKTIAK